METIYKYPIPFEDNFALDLPKGFKILSLQLQFNKPHIWALIDPKQPKVPKTFYLLGTGHPLPSDRDLKYIGTFQLHPGTVVGHLFEDCGIRNW